MIESYSLIDIFKFLFALIGAIWIYYSIYTHKKSIKEIKDSQCMITETNLNIIARVNKLEYDYGTVKAFSTFMERIPEKDLIKYSQAPKPPKAPNLAKEFSSLKKRGRTKVSKKN